MRRPSESNRHVQPTDAIFLTEKQVATRQQRSVKTLRNQRVAGTGIPFRSFGRSVRYAIDDVLAYEAAGLRRSTSDGPQ